MANNDNDIKERNRSRALDFLRESDEFLIIARKGNDVNACSSIGADVLEEIMTNIMRDCPDMAKSILGASFQYIRKLATAGQNTFAEKSENKMCN